MIMNEAPVIAAKRYALTCSGGGNDCVDFAVIDVSRQMVERLFAAGNLVIEQKFATITWYEPGVFWVDGFLSEHGCEEETPSADVLDATDWSDFDARTESEKSVVRETDVYFRCFRRHGDAVIDTCSLAFSRLSEDFGIPLPEKIAARLAKQHNL